MNIADFLSRRAAESPNAAAALNEQYRLNFEQLDRFTWQIATRLHRFGVRPGTRIGLCFSGQFVQLATALAAIRIGAVQMMLSPTAPALELKELAAKAGLSLIVSNRDACAQLGLPLVLVTIPELLETNPDIDQTVRHETGAEPFLLISGSGTTGKSKIIPILASAYPDLLARDNAARRMGFGERHLSASTITYYTALRRALNCITSGTISVFPLSDAHIAKTCRDLAVDHLSIVPVHAQLMLERTKDERVPALPGLKSIMLGGSPVSEEMRQQLRRRINPNLLVVYGANELGETTMAPPAMQDAHPGCVGAPCGSMQIEIVDERDETLPPGKIGHVRLKAPGLFPGYLDDPEASAKALRKGWYYPGDLGSLTSDNVLIFHGRSDDMMIFNGINIYPREIEAVLEAHPAVSEAAAFPVASGPHYQVPAAAIVARLPVQEDELLAWCAERLGNRQPRALLILSELPRNAAGKIRKRELAARFRAEPQQN